MSDSQSNKSSASAIGLGIAALIGAAGGAYALYEYFPWKPTPTSPMPPGKPSSTSNNYWTPAGTNQTTPAKPTGPVDCSICTKSLVKTPMKKLRCGHIIHDKCWTAGIECRKCGKIDQ